MQVIALTFLAVQAALLFGVVALAAWAIGAGRGERSCKFAGAAILLPLAFALLLVINPFDFLFRFKQVIVVETVQLGPTTYTLTQVPEDDFYMTFLERSSDWGSARALLDYDSMKIWCYGHKVVGAVITFHCLPAHGSFHYDTQTGEFEIHGRKRGPSDLGGFFAIK